MIPSYQLLCFLSICFPDAYLYIQGFTEVFQGIALYAFLMLLCDFMAPTDQDKVEFFSSLETKRQWQPKKKRNGLALLSVSVLGSSFPTCRLLTKIILLAELVVCSAIPHHHLGCRHRAGGDSVTSCLLS